MLCGVICMLAVTQFTLPLKAKICIVYVVLRLICC